eukprot:3003814-Rhodomonas_salina.1
MGLVNSMLSLARILVAELHQDLSLGSSKFTNSVKLCFLQSLQFRMVNTIQAIQHPKLLLGCPQKIQIFRPFHFPN